jgi:TMEM175 potassium channel family protein
MNKSRVEAFSDGVFAIAITLLVLTIAQPTRYQDLGHQLATRWPSFAAYVVSFAVIGIMWLNHHSLFSSFERIDRGLFYLNLLLLLTITFLPYPTGVLGEALARGQSAETAAVFYAVTMAVNAYAWTALWLYGSHRRRLLHASFPEGERALATLLFSIGVVLYTLAIGVAFLNAYAFLALQAAFALYYALDPVNRRPGRGRRGSRRAVTSRGAGDELTDGTSLASTPGRPRRRAYGPGRR